MLVLPRAERPFAKGPYLAFLILVVATEPWRADTYFEGSFDGVVIAKALLSVVGVGTAWWLTRDRTRRHGGGMALHSGRLVSDGDGIRRLGRRTSSFLHDHCHPGGHHDARRGPTAERLRRVCRDGWARRRSGHRGGHQRRHCFRSATRRPPCRRHPAAAPKRDRRDQCGSHLVVAVPGRQRTRECGRPGCAAHRCGCTDRLRFPHIPCHADARCVGAAVDDPPGAPPRAHPIPGRSAHPGGRDTAHRHRVCSAHPRGQRRRSTVAEQPHDRLAGGSGAEGLPVADLVRWRIVDEADRGPGPMVVPSDSRQ